MHPSKQPNDTWEYNRTSSMLHAITWAFAAQENSADLLFGANIVTLDFTLRECYHTHENDPGKILIQTLIFQVCMKNRPLQPASNQ
jgi:hypothetical protein